jgi:Transposase
MGEQYVGIDLHRRRSVIVRMTPAGEVLETVRIDNDPVALSLELAKAGPDPEVVLEATYGWYWAADLLQACGAKVHLAHPLGVKMFGYQRVKTDARDSTNLAELLRMGRLPEAWTRWRTFAHPWGRGLSRGVEGSGPWPEPWVVGLVGRGGIVAGKARTAIRSWLTCTHSGP